MLSVIIYYLYHSRSIAVSLGFIFGLVASLLWRQINFEFWVGWEDLLYEPIFKGHLWRYFPDAEKILGVVLNWILPVVLSYAVVSVIKKARSRK